MRVLALLVALVVGASPAAFEVCQIACASSAAASAAAPAMPSCHHGHASTHGMAAHGATSLLPHTDECTHGAGAAMATGFTAPRRADFAASAALPAALAPRPELNARHVRVLVNRHPVESVRLPLSIPLRI